MKAIFQYQVSGQARFADPIETRRRLEVECHGQLREWIDFSKAKNAAGEDNNPEQIARFQGQLVAAARAVFALPPLNPMTGEGIVEDEVWDVLDAFFQFESKKNESTHGSPTSPTLAVSVGASFPTTNPMAFGSMLDDCCG